MTKTCTGHRPILLATWLAAIAGCAAAPVLPTDPGYAVKTARETARLATADDLRARIGVLFDAVEEKAREIEAIGGDDPERLGAACRAHGLLIERGLLPLLEAAIGRGEDPRDLAGDLATALESQAADLRTLKAGSAREAADRALRASRRLAALANRVE